MACVWLMEDGSGATADSLSCAAPEGRDLAIGLLALLLLP